MAYDLVGEVFPMLSPDGQRSMLKQVLELCPTNKILFVSPYFFSPLTCSQQMAY